MWTFLRRWQRVLSQRNITKTETGLSGVRLSINSAWSLAEKMGTPSSIYRYKTGGIISVAKTHDPEGQAKESKQKWIIYKIQAHAHRDKLPKCLQSLGVLPAENEHGRRPVYIGCVRSQSSDLALVTQLLKPNWAEVGKRQVQHRNFQKR